MGKHLTTPERVRIRAIKQFLDDQGEPYSQRKLFRDLGVSERTGRRIINDPSDRTRHNNPDLKETRGAKRKLDDKALDVIEEYYSVKTDSQQRVPVGAIPAAANLGINVSKRTIQRALRKRGVPIRKPKKPEPKGQKGQQQQQEQQQQEQQQQEQQQQAQQAQQQAQQQVQRQVQQQVQQQQQQQVPIEGALLVMGDGQGAGVAPTAPMHRGQAMLPTHQLELHRPGVGQPAWVPVDNQNHGPPVGDASVARDWASGMPNHF